MPQRGPERQSLDPADHSNDHKVQMEGELWEAAAPRTTQLALLTLHKAPLSITAQQSQFLPQEDLDRLNVGSAETRTGWEGAESTMTQQTKFSNTIKGRDICTQVWIRVWWYTPGLHRRDFYLQSLV